MVSASGIASTPTLDARRLTAYKLCKDGLADVSSGRSSCRRRARRGGKAPPPPHHHQGMHAEHTRRLSGPRGIADGYRRGERRGGIFSTEGATCLETEILPLGLERTAFPLSSGRIPADRGPGPEVFGQSPVVMGRRMAPGTHCEETTEAAGTDFCAERQNSRVHPRPLGRGPLYHIRACHRRPTRRIVISPHYLLILPLQVLQKRWSHL